MSEPCMNVEIDLPRRFRAAHDRTIEAWIEGAIPGSQLCIPLINGPDALASCFVSTSAIERNTVVLKASSEGGCLVITAADRASSRLIDLEEARLATRGALNPLAPTSNHSAQTRKTSPEPAGITAAAAVREEMVAANDNCTEAHPQQSAREILRSSPATLTDLPSWACFPRLARAG